MRVLIGLVALTMMVAACGGSGTTEAGGTTAEDVATDGDLDVDSGSAAESPTEDSADAGGTPDGSTSAITESIAVGVVAPLSGGFAALGQDMLNGVTLVAAELEEAGGIQIDGVSYGLSIESCDDEGEGQSAIQCARRLGPESTAIVTLGTWAALPMMEFNEEQGFLILATSGHPDFTTQGNELVMRMVPQGTVIRDTVGEALAVYEENGVEVDSVAIFPSNSDYGASWAGAASEGLAALDRAEPTVIEIDQNGTDFFPQITAARADDPDVIMTTVGCPPAAILVNQAREQGYEGPFLFSNSCADYDALVELVAEPEYLEGSIFESTRWGVGGPLVDEFRARYETTFDDSPEYIAGIGYEAARLLVHAIDQAQTVEDPAAIHAALQEAVTDLQDESLSGILQMDETGETDMRFYFLVVTDGVPQPVE